VLNLIVERIRSQLGINGSIELIHDSNNSLIVQINCHDLHEFETIISRLVQTVTVIEKSTPAKYVKLCLQGKAPLTFPIAEILMNPLSQESEPPAFNTTPHAALLAVAKAANAGGQSCFILSYDGTYLAYLPRVNGRSIIPEEQMIGQKAFALLPPELRNIVQRYHDLACATGQPQRYEYVNVWTQRWSKNETIVIPYPEYQQVAIVIKPITISDQPLHSSIACPVIVRQLPDQ
jgi:hypothetical protein